MVVKITSPIQPKTDNSLIDFNAINLVLIFKRIIYQFVIQFLMLKKD